METLVVIELYRREVLKFDGEYDDDGRRSTM